MTIATIPSEYLAERIAEAEREVTFLQARYDGLRDGTDHWTTWCEDYTCPDRQQVAAEECGQALDSARRDLAALEAQAETAAPGRQGGNAG